VAAVSTDTSTATRVAVTVLERPAYLAIVALAAALVAPFVLANSYQINVLVLVLLFILLALSLDLLLGYMGYLSLAHHGLWAVGAYTSAILSVKAGLDVWPSVLAATLFTGLFGAALAVPAFRVRGHYFALATLAIGELIRIVINNWVGLTEGPFGLTDIPSPALPAVGSLDTRLEFYYVILAIVVAVVLGFVRLLRSPYGRCLRTIREDEDLAEAQGLHLMHYKVSAYAISASIAGVSGALFAHYQHVIGPDNFEIHFMAEMLVIVIVGGSGVLAGLIVGPLIFIPLPEFLRGLNQLGGESGFVDALSESRLLVFGALLIFIIIRAPEGLAGRARAALRRRAGAVAPDRPGPEVDPDERGES
jgi:branched-chain amino acid transport system permease protein